MELVAPSFDLHSPWYPSTTVVALEPSQAVWSGKSQDQQIALLPLRLVLPWKLVRASAQSSAAYLAAVTLQNHPPKLALMQQILL